MEFSPSTPIALEALLMTVFASCAVAVSVSNASSATTIVNFFDIETSSYRNVIQVKSRGSGAIPASRGHQHTPHQLQKSAIADPPSPICNIYLQLAIYGMAILL